MRASPYNLHRGLLHADSIDGPCLLIADLRRRRWRAQKRRCCRPALLRLVEPALDIKSAKNAIPLWLAAEACGFGSLLRHARTINATRTEGVPFCACLSTNGNVAGLRSNYSGFDDDADDVDDDIHPMFPQGIWYTILQKTNAFMGYMVSGIQKAHVFIGSA